MTTNAPTVVLWLKADGQLEQAVKFIVCTGCDVLVKADSPHAEHCPHITTEGNQL